MLRLNWQAMIRELVDVQLDMGTRIDLAMCLSESDEPGVEEALVSVAANPNEFESLRDACGESLGEIWARRGVIPDSICRGLTPCARDIAIATFQAMRGERS